VIRVTRDATNRPEGFEARAEVWREKLRTAKAADSRLTASKFWTKVRPDLRDDAALLAKVFRGKCAFCESTMAHVQHPHIEHYRPKGMAEFEGLMFAWENWLLSCGRCNTTKSTGFPRCDDGLPCMIDPTAEDPAPHLDFAQAVVGGVTNRGNETIKLAGLSRGPLEEARARWLSLTVGVLLLLTLHASSRGEARDLLVWCVSDEAPWTACTRAYLRSRAPKLLVAAPVVIAGDPLQRIHDLIESQKGALAHLE
jgi:uncharacterized protein (TIGR02646 family)